MNKIIFAIVAIVAIIFALPVSAKSVEKPGAGLELCGLCVNLMDDAIQNLIDIIANVILNKIRGKREKNRFFSPLF